MCNVQDLRACQSLPAVGACSPTMEALGQAAFKQTASLPPLKETPIMPGKFHRHTASMFRYFASSLQTYPLKNDAEASCPFAGGSGSGQMAGEAATGSGNRMGVKGARTLGSEAATHTCAEDPSELLSSETESGKPIRPQVLHLLLRVIHADVVSRGHPQQS